MGRIAVIGAGVIGLSVAYELAGAGHDVTVLADRDHTGAVSSVAAAIWFPHAVDAAPRVLESARLTRDRLASLAADARTGVRLRTGTVLTRRPDPDLSWTAAVPGHRPATAAELPPGAAGVTCELPVAVTNVYLAWLRASVLGRGVEIRAVALGTPDEAGEGFDAVVVAAGIRSGALLGGDDQVFPIRGQIVRLANPGLTRWLLDDDNPDGLTYVVPRDDDVVCGGTGDAGSWDETADPDVERAILRRVTALVPELAGAPIVSRAVGLRPARTSVRLERVDGYAVPVIAAYGHGGSGFTLSWGEAARVRELIDAL
ncbi:FAD-dependent oxidoreductase [Catenuloplanes atrovinosus]|uniref:D-amino-acid oxidase n=1 Tax=Catenuloplanes atrovinosus TaxID=137266 RepID=A0AAE4CCG2_9ACTN|nr:FAD-dependent oxidoreductase [Catenuloplanes atrovinosus]MDR7276480.1 D-amino-acid oxidase [Catenuloplanes atrovinosus]